MLTVRPEGVKKKVNMAASTEVAIQSPPADPVMAGIYFVVLAAGVACRAHFRLRPLARKRCCRF
jgi:hypothetical protein